MAKTSKEVQERYGKNATYDTEREYLRQGNMKKTFDRWGESKTKAYLDVEMETRIRQDSEEEHRRNISAGRKGIPDNLKKKVK